MIAFFSLVLLYRIKTMNKMAIQKTAAFDTQEQDLAAFAKAIAHPARIAILKVLAQRNECICGEIVDILPLAQATVSQHLKALKAAGLINGTISGPRSCYCINWDAFNKFTSTFNTTFDKMQQQNQSCCC